MWTYEGVEVNKYEKTTHSEKNILQFTKNGEFLCEYNSLTYATKITGISRTNISNCLRNRSKSAGGYHWKYK